MGSTMHDIRLFRDRTLGILFCFIGGLLPALKPKRLDLSKKTAIVTGANSGIGYGFALQLAEMGATVFLACRNEKKAAQARDEMLKVCPNAKVETLSLDTSSFSSVKAFVKDWNHGHIDILAHNAGAGFLPNGRELTEDGFQYQYQVNFLSSFLLTSLLEKHLAEDGRVVLTSSIGSYFASLSSELADAKSQPAPEAHSTPAADYSRTKLLQAAFAAALQNHFDQQQTSNTRHAYSFQPGLVQSNIFSTTSHDFLGRLQHIFGVDSRQGSATGVHLATSQAPEVLENGGRYFDRMRPRVHTIDSLKRDELEKVWSKWCTECEVSWES